MKLAVKHILILCLSLLCLPAFAAAPAAGGPTLEDLHGTWLGDMEATMQTKSLTLKKDEHLLLPTLNINTRTNSLQVKWPDSANYNKEIHFTVIEQQGNVFKLEGYGRIITIVLENESTLMVNEGFPEMIVFTRDY